MTPEQAEAKARADLRRIPHDDPRFTAALERYAVMRFALGRWYAVGYESDAPYLRAAIAAIEEAG